MSVVKLSDIALTDITKSKNNYFEYNNNILKIQTDYQKIYGIQKIDKFHETDKSRMIINIPLLENINNFTKLDNIFKILINNDKYNSIIKKSQQGHPSLKFLFNNNITIRIITNKHTYIYDYTTLKDFEKEIKGHYQARFILVPKIWEFDGKTGVSLYINTIEIKIQENPINSDCSFID